MILYLNVFGILNDVEEGEGESDIRGLMPSCFISKSRLENNITK